MADRATSKKRVIAAIRFKSPDLIPIDIWPMPASFKKHGKRLEKLFEKYKVI